MLIKEMKLILLRILILVSFLKISSGGSINESEEIEEDEETEEEKEIKVDEEITEAELLKIASEDHIQDPLNSFYDPFEPYRIITYAYWNPITNPALHKNPQLPPNFLPPNAPPKSLPADFFFQDTAARQIVLEEHAAAFCPFLRRWRESNPIKPFPVGLRFSDTHPAIKFTPGVGYDIDTELEMLNIVSRQATDEFARKLELDSVARMMEAEAEARAANPEAFVEEPSSPVNPQNESRPVGKVKEPKRIADLDILLSKIEEVKGNRSDCRKLENFIAPPAPLNMNIDYPSSCLQEVIFLLEEHEDRTSPIGRESNIPEIVDKVEHFRQILLKRASSVGASDQSKGKKCPFGFKSPKKPVPEPKPLFVPVKTKKTFYKGTVPKFAQLNEGEELFPSQSESEFENVTKYLFSYKLVPFPSIQNTLKKYVSI